MGRTSSSLVFLFASAVASKPAHASQALEASLAPALGADSVCNAGESACNLELLQVEGAAVRRTARTGIAQSENATGVRDLVLVHIPFNFGHTVELVSCFPEYVLNSIAQDPEGTPSTKEDLHSFKTAFVAGNEGLPPQLVMGLKKPGGEVWGHLNPDLQEHSNITGCPLYYTPPKYWSSSLAKKYFGDKITFGMLRDPYERLVSLFRGDFDGYGGKYAELRKTCDVNSAVKQMLKTYMEGSTFAEGCTFLPQAEYFDGPYGIKLPIDNRRFPESMNQAYKEHGYDFHIRTIDIQHVDGCDNVWAADLDDDTKAMVRKVYSRDFQLLCSRFGYCDDTENVCLTQVPRMCPEKAFTWNSSSMKFVPK